MASNIDGALYREVIGPAGAPLMVFVHPNPMDNAAWMYQLAHLSTWYRCVAVDLPGYGRSPRARPGVTLFDLAEACWDAVEAEGAGPVVLVGCSINEQLHESPQNRRSRGGGSHRPRLSAHSQ